MRVRDSIKLIKTPADAGRAGSRPKPPTAVARSASLEAEWPVSDHQKATAVLVLAYRWIFSIFVEGGRRVLVPTGAFG
jgi:hypothetical protein